MNKRTVDGTEWVITEQVGEVTEEMIDTAILYARVQGSVGSTWAEHAPTSPYAEPVIKGSVTVYRADRL